MVNIDLVFVDVKSIAGFIEARQVSRPRDCGIRGIDS
jgi:hypothetical protein